MVNGALSASRTPSCRLGRRLGLANRGSAGFGMGILLDRVVLQQCVQSLLIPIRPKLVTNTEAGATLLASRDPVIEPMPFYFNLFPWRGIAVMVIGALFASRTPCRKVGPRLRTLLFHVVSFSCAFR